MPNATKQIALTESECETLRMLGKDAMKQASDYVNHMGALMPPDHKRIILRTQFDMLSILGKIRE